MEWQTKKTGTRAKTEHAQHRVMTSTGSSIFDDGPDPTSSSHPYSISTASTDNAELTETCYCDIAPIAERSPSEPELMAEFNLKVEELGLSCISGVGSCPELQEFRTELFLEFLDTAFGEDDANTSSISLEELEMLVDNTVDYLINLYNTSEDGETNICDPSFRTVETVEVVTDLVFNNVDEDDGSPSPTVRHLYSVDAQSGRTLLLSREYEHPSAPANSHRSLRVVTDLENTIGVSRIVTAVTRITGTCLSCVSYTGNANDVSASTRRRRRAEEEKENYDPATPSFMKHGAQRNLNDLVSSEAAIIEDSQCFCPSDTDEVLILNVNDIFNGIREDVDLGDDVVLTNVELIETIECDANTTEFDAEDLELALSVLTTVVPADVALFATLFRNTYNDLVDGFCDGQFLSLSDVVVTITQQPGATPNEGGCVPASTLVDSSGDCRGCSDGTPLVSDDPDAARRSLQEIKIDLGAMGLLPGTAGNDGERQHRRRRLELNNACVCADDAIRDRSPTLSELYVALKAALQKDPIGSICGLTAEVAEDLPTLSPTEFVPHDICDNAQLLVEQTVSSLIDPDYQIIANDNFADDCFATDYSTTVAANPDLDLSQPPNCIVGETERGVWVTFTITDPGVYFINASDDSVSFDSSAPPDTNILVALFSGDDCSTLDCIDTYRFSRGKPADEDDPFAERRLSGFPSPELELLGDFVALTDTGTTYYALLQSSPSLPFTNAVLMLRETCENALSDIAAFFCLCAPFSFDIGYNLGGPLVPPSPYSVNQDSPGFVFKYNVPGFDVGQTFYFVFDGLFDLTSSLSVVMTKTDDNCESYTALPDFEILSPCTTIRTIRPFTFTAPGTFYFLLQGSQFGEDTEAFVDPQPAAFASKCDRWNSCFCSKDMGTGAGPFSGTFSMDLAANEADGCFDYGGCNVGMDKTGVWLTFTTASVLPNPTFFLCIAGGYKLFLYKSNEVTGAFVAGCDNFECVAANGFDSGDTAVLETDQRYYVYVETTDGRGDIDDDTLTLRTSMCPA